MQNGCKNFQIKSEVNLACYFLVFLSITQMIRHKLGTMCSSDHKVGLSEPGFVRKRSRSGIKHAKDRE